VRAHANRGLARAALAAELRRDTIEAGLRVAPVSAAAVSAFADTYADVDARLVTTKTPVPWLGGRTRGVALAGFAPARVLAMPTGVSATVQTAAGPVSVQAVEDTLPLGAVPPSLARPAIVAGLTKLAKDDAYQSWLLAKERNLVAVTTCVADDVPAPLPVELESYLPFLDVS
jgi:hypothetical protein